MKKIFALVLSLCLVCSSFVAVSAQEMVYNEGVYNEGVWNPGTPFTSTRINVGSDFEDGVNDMGVGDANFATSIVEIDGRKALKVDHPASASHTGIISFALVDENGNGVDINGPTAPFGPDTVINWTVDVKMENIETAAPKLILRDGSKTAPAGHNATLKDIKPATSGEWAEFSGSVKIGDLGWQQADANGTTNLTIRFYPQNKTGTIYVDNMTLSIDGKYYYDPQGSEDKSLATSGLEYGPSVSGVSYADGYATATLGGTGNTSMVGTWLRDTNGEKYVPQAGDKITWSVDLNPSAAFTLSGGTARGVILRTGGNGASDNLQPSGNYKLMSTGTAPANTWTTVSGTYEIPSTGFTVSGWTGICIRTEFTGTLKVKNLKYSITRTATTVVEPGWDVEPGWEVEEGWATPDYSVPFTQSYNTTFGKEENGVYVFETETIANKLASGSNNAYTGSSFLEPTTALYADGDWEISYDLTMEGMKAGTTDVWARCVNDTNADNYNDAHTVGYIKSTVAVADGTVRLTFKSSDMVAGGAAITDPIVKIGLTFASKPFCDYDNKTDVGSYSMSNFVITSNESKVALSADKTANGVNLTLTNANAQKYSFAGRLLAAEYEVVDGVKELVQFAEVAVNEEIEAGTNKVVTAEFEGAIAAGNQVYVFVWEPASFSPITMFVK